MVVSSDYVMLGEILIQWGSRVRKEQQTNLRAAAPAEPRSYVSAPWS